MKKILILIVLISSIISVKSQTGIFDDVFFKNIYLKSTVDNPDEQTHYHISSTSAGVFGTPLLDVKWWGGMNLETEAGNLKLKTGNNGIIYLSSSGYTGINTDMPSRTLTVSGDIYANRPSSSISFQDDTRFTVTQNNVSTLAPPSISMPQYGFMAPNALGSAELWMSGNAGIRMFTGGDANPRFSMSNVGNAAFQGKLEAREIKVTQTPTTDFVFEEGYALPNLEDVEKYIKEKKHLPEVASAREMEKEGVNVGEFQIKLLQKIEELTLYSIEQNEEIKHLQQSNKSLEEEIKEIKSMFKNKN